MPEAEYDARTGEYDTFRVPLSQNRIAFNFFRCFLVAANHAQGVISMYAVCIETASLLCVVGGNQAAMEDVYKFWVTAMLR